MNVSWGLTIVLAIGVAVAVSGLYEWCAVRPLRRSARREAVEVHAIGRALASQAALVGRLEAAERELRDRVRQLGDRVGSVERRDVRPAHARMLDLGGRERDPAGLVAGFGFSEGEASLVRLLHGAGKSDHRPGPNS